jgi:PEGA domain
MKRIMAYALSSLLLFSSSCATLLKGTTDNMTVVSDPVGAEVKVNGDVEGTTPVSFTVASNEDLNIQIAKEGYEPQDIDSPARFRWGWELLSFVSYVIPVLVDVNEGAAWGHDQTTITADLEPVARPGGANPLITPPAPAAGAAAISPPATAVSPAAPKIERQGQISK